MRIDLNADLGELPGAEGAALDEAILAQVTSCSVACGGHAGDEETMRRTVRAAKAAGVALGAHPSYPDREGFGRRSLTIGAEALAASLGGQVEALARIAAGEDVPLRHLKPHGALYGDAAEDVGLAEIVAACAREAGLALYGPPPGALPAAARGVAYVAEGFADRAYAPDGRLLPRTEAGAVIEDEERQANQALRLARGEPVETSKGPLTLSVRTICLHSDTPGAVASAAMIRRRLEAAGIVLGAPDG